MTRVLFCVIPEKGHLNPYIGPAQALQSLGAEVVFHAPADVSTMRTPEAAYTSWCQSWACHFS